jgi:hypothetical protein
MKDSNISSDSSISRGPRFNFVFEVPAMSLQDAHLECKVDITREFVVER